MIRHVVLLKFKAAITQAEINYLFEQLSGLQENISEIKNYSSGKNISPDDRSQGYNYCFTMDFANMIELHNYLYHPLHEKFKNDILFQLIDKNVDPPIVVDYEL